MKSSKEKNPILWLTIIICIYSSVAFLRLGTLNSPQTVWETEDIGTEIILDFGKEIELDSIVYFLGNYGSRYFSLETGTKLLGEWETNDNLRMAQVYQWHSESINKTARYLKLTTLNVYTKINEILFTDCSGNVLIPINASEYPELFDETDSYVGKATYETGTVFDEPVYARTAYEYLNNMRPFEDTHPPLGKILIAPGIALFGMNPFGWRFMGTLAGVCMLVVIAAFAYRLFDNPWISVPVTTIFAFDFMHFTHTRLAQVDSFLVLFIICMFYFTYLYGEEIRTPQFSLKRAIVYLFLTGINLGLAISCKWSGAYCIPGILMLFFVYTYCSFRKKIIHIKEVGILVFIYLLFTTIVPACVYMISYIPYKPIDESLGFWDGMVYNQISMFKFHTGLSAGNPESAKWYQWPLMAVPLTYCRLTTNGLKECVYLFGNPVFWLSGIFGVFYCIYEAWNSKNRNALFLIVMYLSPMIPWILIPRSSFIYHYFPSLPSMALMLGVVADSWRKRGFILLTTVAILSVIVFVIFYPILSGVRVPIEYVEFLEWLPWWEF